MKCRQLTQERLQALLIYDSATGAFTNKASRGTLKAGAVAGGLGLDGYLRISIDNVRHAAHRLAWLYTEGDWPCGHIDHINGIRSDNRIANLRDVEQVVNNQNRRHATKGSATGVLGVRKMRDKFQARINVDGREIGLGTYRDPQMAGDAYITAKRKLHAGCSL